MTRLMIHLKTGITPDFALQKAQLNTLNYRDNQGNYSYANDPTLWAGLTIFGEPGLVE
ncbi:hypothetical protein [Erythrobacter insulae]|uniref:hypothetical protein n=1 Tax=Erythrobacter insulae TaxID=2584124 RepID=UPI00163D981B|nr:hypothetical protein [Erythrobacter insulae]